MDLIWIFCNDGVVACKDVRANLRNREPIFQLREKIDILSEAAFQKFSIAQSRAALAEYCGIKAKSLTSACDASGMALEMQAKLSEAIGFDLQNVAWIDRSVPMRERYRVHSDRPRRDGAQDFRSYLFVLLGLSQPIRYALQAYVPHSPIRDIASISVTDYRQTVMAGSDVHVHLGTSVRKGTLEGDVQFGFQKFRVRATFSEDSRLQIVDRLASKKGECKVSAILVEAQGTEFDPQWEFSHPGGIFDQEVNTNDEPLLKIHPLELPVRLEVELLLHPHDGSLVSGDGSPLSDTNKDRVVQCLMVKMIDEDRRTNGSLAVSRQVAEVKAMFDV